MSKPPGQNLAHSQVVVRMVQVVQAKKAILLLGGPSLDKDRHGGARLATLKVGDVEALHANGRRAKAELTGQAVEQIHRIRAFDPPLKGSFGIASSQLHKPAAAAAPWPAQDDAAAPGL